jgi:hypothetical protein
MNYTYYSLSAGAPGEGPIRDGSSCTKKRRNEPLGTDLTNEKAPGWEESNSGEFCNITITLAPWLFQTTSPMLIVGVNGAAECG